jgi:YegS/Rv2252/BmrU family lipid kinase
MRTRAIVNPRSAGGRTRGRWPAVEARLRERIGELDSVYTERLGHATELAREALREGFEQVVAVGGDGTVNEIVNGFFEDGRPINPTAVLGIVMLGTGGDLRRSLGMTGEIDDYVERLSQGSIRTIDLGRIETVGTDGRPQTRWFDNIAGFGVSAETVATVNRAGFSKKLGTAFAMNWAALRSFARYRSVPVRIRIDDDFDEEVPTTAVAIANGQFFGGGMQIAPGAVLDDGLFDVVLVSGIGTLRFLLSVGKLYRGEHLSIEGISVRRGRRVTATPPAGARMAIDADGETAGNLPATFEIVPGALRVRA